MSSIHETPTWIGLQFGNYLLEELIADGPYSWIYKARKLDQDHQAAFKIAKPIEFVTRSQGRHLTQAKAVFEGGVSDITPYPNELILAQQWRMVTGSAFVSRGKTLEQAGMHYYVMDYVDGQTLRGAMAASVPVDTLLELGRKLQKINTDQFSEYHGDLKPENILLSDDGVRLIDPGYYGPLNCLEGSELECVVTTPLYQPFLKPDDLFAVGLLVWEAACREHPLAAGDDLTADSSQAVGESVRKWVKQYENVGQYFLSPILKLQRPSFIVSEMPMVLEQVLLKGMRLQIGPDGLIERGPGFSDFNEWISAFESLRAAGISSL